MADTLRLMSWLFVLNPNLTAGQVHDLITKRREHEQNLRAEIEARCDRILNAEGLDEVAKLNAATSYLRSVLPLLFW